MRQRIFIAINLPEEIKKRLSDYCLRWPELPCRWTKKENMHITLIFLGYVNNEELLEILAITKTVAARNKSFLINLNKICYGPGNKKPIRMVWAEGKESRELARLQRDLENAIEGKVLNFKKENRVFVPHITLGRIRSWEFRRMEPEERPEINEDISLSFEVNSIEVMESRLKRGGSEYTILESILLSK